MPLTVKSAAASATKLVQRATGAAQDYAVQAEAAGDKWATQTQSADGNFFQAVSQPSVRGRFRAGVAKAGAAKFGRGIRDKGAGRYSGGVTAGQQDYAQGVEPYLQTLASLNLPARRPRGDSQNYMRVNQVGAALNAKRIALLGGQA